MQKFLIGAIVLASLLAGVSAYLLFRNSPEEVIENIPADSPIKEAEEDLPTTGNGTLMGLATLGKNLECTIAYNKDMGAVEKIEGTYFTSLGRMRGDFIVTGLPDGSVSSMILNDGYMYSWTEVGGQKYGMKVELNAVPQEAAPDTREPVPLSADVSFDCKPWVNVDGSVFEVPKDIVFTDYSDIMKQGMEYGTTYEVGSTAASCQSCNTLTGDLREQCLVSLQCE